MTVESLIRELNWIADECELAGDDEDLMFETLGVIHVLCLGLIEDYDADKSTVVDDGVQSKLDKNRIAHCGNAIIPQIAEIIGKRLVDLPDKGH